MVEVQTSSHPQRTTPRLWVETLWLLDSLDTSKPLREILLSRGVNLVLSAPSAESTGHGVGKTAFCQILRFVLEDPHWTADGSLLDELKHAFPEGAAAARVHIDDEAWTVVKPWRHQLGYRAARQAGWAAVAHDEVANEHASYVETLKRTMVGSFPATTFPGTDQPIEWKHLLAWLSRDQNCRYLDYYHWRSSGIGFPFPAKSPTTLMKMVLGLLDDPGVLHQLKTQQKKLAQEEAKLEELRRRPDILRDHVKHQLAEALGQPESSPFRSTGLFPVHNLKALAEQRCEACNLELERCHSEREALELQRSRVLAQREPIARNLKITENKIAQDEALLAGNSKTLEELKKKPESLQALLPTLCTAGNVLFGDCHYVRKQLETVSIDSQRQTVLRGSDADMYRQRIAKFSEAAATFRRQLEPSDRELMEISNSLTELDNRRVDALAQRQQLKEAIKNFETYDDIVESRSEWPELEQQKSQLRTLETQIDQLKLQVRKASENYTARKAKLASAFDALAKKLPSISWGVVHEDEPRPFCLGNSHSAALAVLEMLAGDFVCLADSANAESHHPGFLLHDSPREAELSEPVFWAFLSEAVGQGDAFQYIVTTSTRAPEAFRQYVRLELGNHREDEMLFLQRLGVEQASLESR
ncbi:MAG TPA: hypothetical protein VFL78_07800 [Rhodanobacteraceae bacterium]|nr:hypothetical protein [Rhodanobacteraceae bacterium]